MNDSDSQPRGVGPHAKPWPTDAKFDRTLLQNGDHRNVEDRFRYWTNQAIIDELNKSRSNLEIAIENWQHDFNIGTIVRNANAFNLRAVHIIGKKQWNKRGAMVTNIYLNVYHHTTVAEFVAFCGSKTIIAIDNQAGAQLLSKTELPPDCVLVFGGEGPGLSPEMIAASQKMVAIEQFGSTRSVNVGVASGIVLYEWMRRNHLPKVD